MSPESTCIPTAPDPLTETAAESAAEADPVVLRGMLDVDALAMLRYQAQVVSWSRIFRHYGIDHLVLKGVGFDQWLGRTRLPRDLDIMVPRWRLRRAAGLLRDAGYRKVSTETTATTWAGPDGTVPIDLHDSMKAVGAAHHEVWQAFTLSATTVPIAQAEVPVLGSPARELHVVLHLAQSGLHDSRAIADFDLALGLVPTTTWVRARQLATELGCRALFDAPFACHPNAERAGLALQIAPAEADWLTDVSPARSHAMSLVGISLQQSRAERLVLTRRLLQLHPSTISELQGERSNAGSTVDAYRHRASEFTRAWRSAQELRVAFSTP